MNKRKLVSQGLLVVLSICVGLIVVSSAAAGQKGEWEITTTMEIPGMPFAMPATTMRRCLEDQAVPYQEKGDEKCEVVSKKVSGNTLNWKVVCNGPEGKNEMTGVTKYTGETMDTRIQMKSGGGGEISMRMTGKRLGACR